MTLCFFLNNFKKDIEPFSIVIDRLLKKINKSQLIYCVFNFLKYF